MSNPFSRFFGFPENKQHKDELGQDQGNIALAEDYDHELLGEGNELEIKEILLSDIVPNKYQPREVFEEDRIKELANSLHTHGLIQPIVLRKQEDSNLYEIVAGERRYRAAKLLEWTHIEAIIRTYDDKKTAAVALIENIQRENLTPIEEARAFQELIDLYSLTQEALAQRLGKGQSTVANKIRLLALPGVIQESLLNREITERHGRALLTFKDDEEKMLKVFNQVIEHNLNVKQTDELIARLQNNTPAKPKRKIKIVGKNIRLAVNELNRVFKTMDDFGYTYDRQEEETEEHYIVTIKIPKEKE